MSLPDATHLFLHAKQYNARLHWENWWISWWWGNPRQFRAKIVASGRWQVPGRRGGSRNLAHTSQLYNFPLPPKNSILPSIKYKTPQVQNTSQLYPPVLPCHLHFTRIQLYQTPLRCICTPQFCPDSATSPRICQMIWLYQFCFNCTIRWSMPHLAEYCFQSSLNFGSN